jgi:ABC-type multidrug transport system ATPase subunit
VTWIQSQTAPTIESAAKSAFGLLSSLQYRLIEESSRPILSEFSGIINPGEMLLVIGKPGSGCTTLLKALSYMWEEYKEVRGELKLNGHPIQDLLAKRPQDVIFCGKSFMATVLQQMKLFVTKYLKLNPMTISLR